MGNKNGAMKTEDAELLDLLRFMVNLSEGFSLEQSDGFENIIYSRNGYIFKQRLIGFQKCLIYPQLLQRACEYCGVYLKKHGSYYTANYYEYREFQQSTNPDTAKESALKYIMKHQSSHS